MVVHPGEHDVRPHHVALLVEPNANVAQGPGRHPERHVLRVARVPLEHDVAVLVEALVPRELPVVAPRGHQGTPGPPLGALAEGLPAAAHALELRPVLLGPAALFRLELRRAVLGGFDNGRRDDFVGRGGARLAAPARKVQGGVARHQGDFLLLACGDRESRAGIGENARCV